MRLHACRSRQRITGKMDSVHGSSAPDICLWRANALPKALHQGGATLVQLAAPFRVKLARRSAVAGAEEPERFLDLARVLILVTSGGDIDPRHFSCITRDERGQAGPGVSHRGHRCLHINGKTEKG